MSSDESDFDRLLREAREWDARDRARHKALDMEADGDARPSVAGSQAPAAPKAGLPQRAQAITNVLNAAMKQKQVQAQPSRGKRGAWGWVWLLVVLYFAIKFFAHK